MQTRVLGVAVMTFLIGLAWQPSLLLGHSAEAAQKAAATTQVDINTATAAQLETLPGIGPKTAERIIEYRQKAGGFKKIEELMNVRGIGEKNFLKLKPLITAVPVKTDRRAGSAS